MKKSSMKKHFHAVTKLNKWWVDDYNEIKFIDK
jgi:hypothetical protein